MRSRKWVLRALYFLLGVQVSIYDFTLKRDFVEYNIPISNIMLRMFLIHLIWQIKLVPATICDLYGFGGYHRRPYIIVSNFFAALMAIILSAPEISEGGYVALLAFFNIFICIADVNYDACIVEDGRDEDNDKKGKLQTQMWAFRYIGQAVGDAAGPLLWKAWKSEGVYSFLSIVCLFSLFSGVILKDRQRKGAVLNTKDSATNTTLDYAEKDVIVGEVLDEQGRSKFPEKKQEAGFFYLIKLVKETLEHPVLRRLLLFNFIVSLLPNAGIALFYYLTDEIGFTPWQMATLGFITGVGRIVGINIYSCFNQISMKKIYVVVGALSIAITAFPILLAIQVPVNDNVHNNHSVWYPVDNSTYKNHFTNQTIGSNDTVPVSDLLGLDRFWCALSDDTIGQVLDEIRSMPVLNIAAAVCKKAVEASAYASTLSLLNISNGLNRFVSSGFMRLLGIDHGKFENLWILIMIASLAELLSTVASYFIIPSITLKDVADEIRENEEIIEETVDLAGDENGDGLDEELRKELPPGVRLI